MEPFSMSATTLNAVASTSFYMDKSSCFTRFKRGTKQKFMRNIKCVVVSDVYRNKIFNDLYTSSEDLKMLNLEKLFEVAFPPDAIKSLRRIKVEDIDVYMALCIKPLRDLLKRYRLNNKTRSVLYLFVSSVKLAKQLGVKEKNIKVFLPTNYDLLGGEKSEELLKKYHSLLDEKNEGNYKKINKYSFESYEGLLNQLMKMEPALKLHKKYLKEQTIQGAEEEKAEEEDIKTDITEDEK